MHFFYAHKNEKDKCSWLSRLQSATSTAKQNIVAYNSPGGVCFEAVKDIAVGEELMVLFDKSFKGNKKKINTLNSRGMVQRKRRCNIECVWFGEVALHLFYCLDVFYRWQVQCIQPM